MCAGAELLFLSGGFELLSYRGSAGAAEPGGISGAVCGAGLFLSFRKLVRQIRVRVAVPLRAGAGFDT